MQFFNFLIQNFAITPATELLKNLWERNFEFLPPRIFEPPKGFRVEVFDFEGPLKIRRQNIDNPFPHIFEQFSC